MLRKFYYYLFPATILRHRFKSGNDVNVDLEYLEQIDYARIDLRDLIIQKRCAAIMLRLAWTDVAPYDELILCGGPNGSIRFEEEYSKPINKGLKFALDLCEEVKSKYPKITYADLYQLAGVVAVEVTGGPKITFTPGRFDLKSSDSQCSTLTNRIYNPSRTFEIDAHNPRLVFDRLRRLGTEIVALSVARTLGRANPERSGYDGFWTNNPSKFDNLYFVALTDLTAEGMLRIPTNNILIQDPEFFERIIRYAQDSDYIIESYAEAHRKFSEFGYERKIWNPDFARSRYKAVPQKNRAKNSILWLTAGLIAVGALNYFCQCRKNPK